MRAPGMTFWRMPLLVWANLSTSLLVVAATPFISGAQFMVLLDRILHTNFFEFGAGGDVISYQHIFWFYSHPAVYIMILPGFGIISEVISVHARKPIFGYRLMALALIGIVVLSYSVWAHHMFVAGVFSWLRVPMMLTTLLIAVPTGIKIFSWLGTLYFGKIHTYSTAMLFALAFIVTFTIGGISGVMLGAVQLVFLYNMVVSWRFGPRAVANPWRANSIEWQVSSPPPIYNFTAIPRVVGGPYEFGVPGARHAIMDGDAVEVPASEASAVGSG
jgi:cytochrome c oxidase subunit 1